jgi:mono/diheme cytochrome c family protein
MPKPPRADPEHFEPACSNAAWIGTTPWGSVFMFVLVVAFPLYRCESRICAPRQSPNRPPSTNASADALFNQSCASCHGKAATGGSAPTLNSKQS